MAESKWTRHEVQFRGVPNDSRVSSIKLKKTSKYYYQVQGQLLVTRRNKCYFVVYTFAKLPKH